MKALITWTLKVGLVVVIFVGLAYAHFTIASLRRAAAEAQQQLREKPDKIFYEAAVEAELSRHEFDIRRVEAYVPPREEIINVISSIENEGARQTVAVTVAAINEKLVLDEAGKPISVPGPLEDVIIEMVAVGEPVNLMRFLYGLDHLPYVLKVESWHLSPDRNAALRPPPPVPTEEVETPRPQSRLEVTAVMASKKSDYEQEQTSLPQE